jgi:hypothetical protein
MNFDFSDDLKCCVSTRENSSPHTARATWSAKSSEAVPDTMPSCRRRSRRLGWLETAVPEAYGDNNEA